ncbi:MAG: hypothetical protein GXY34_09995 [Syntrophomonadaceae bacterium]|mgnify:CR=1 FL=1|nr:hypothetical protein [Syntrophomonadaceae bacterium]
MPKKKKDDKSDALKQNTQKNQGTGGNACPQKDGDNCLVPGVYSDSDPIGGG